MKWSQRISIDQVLAKVSASRTLNADGSRGYAGFGDRDRWDAILASAIHDPSISETLRRIAIDRASASNQNLDAEGFRQAYFREVENFKKSRRTYLVSYPMWGRVEYLADQKKLPEARLHFKEGSTRTWTTVAKERRRLAADNKEMLESGFKGATELRTIVAKVTAINPAEAQELAGRALTTYLGALSILDNRGKLYSFYSGVQRPLNELLVAPFISVHDSRGKLAHEGYWYHTWHPKFHFVNRRSDEKITAVKENADKLLEYSRRSRWPLESRQVLRMYYEAFSEHEASTSFLAAWRVLELVAGGGEGRKTKSEQLIDRAAKCFHEYEKMKLVGLHLMVRRDALVHGGRSDFSDMSTLVYQINEFITPLLIKFIRNFYDFHCPDEFWEFFDLPIERGGVMQKRRALSRKQYLLKCADRFRGS